jgi:predicted O-methyltransferase YrrM
MINNKTFHHHYYVLLDIANNIKSEVNYLEIGCYAGGSASLMLSRDKTNVISIDLGTPISKHEVLENIKLTNTKNNKYDYIEGDSQKQETKDAVLKIRKTFDILFIDGDHQYDAVIKDFNLYSPLVKSGGYIVFDDYNDHQYCPEVKKAVDELVKNLDSYDIIGCLENKFGARPSELKEGNCFIIRKK